MAKTVAVIGVDPAELAWVRMLLFLLRHPDPIIAEMVRQALLYLERNTRGESHLAAEEDWGREFGPIVPEIAEGRWRSNTAARVPPPSRREEWGFPP